MTFWSVLLWPIGIMIMKVFDCREGEDKWSDTLYTNVCGDMDHAGNRDVFAVGALDS